MANDFHEDAIRCEITHFLWPSWLYQLINKEYTRHTRQRRCVGRAIWLWRENVRHINDARGHITTRRVSEHTPHLRNRAQLSINLYRRTVEGEKRIRSGKELEPEYYIDRNRIRYNDQPDFQSTQLSNAFGKWVTFPLFDWPVPIRLLQSHKRISIDVNVTQCISARSLNRTSKISIKLTANALVTWSRSRLTETHRSAVVSKADRITASNTNRIDVCKYCH